MPLCFIPIGRPPLTPIYSPVFICICIIAFVPNLSHDWSFNQFRCFVRLLFQLIYFGLNFCTPVYIYVHVRNKGSNLYVQGSSMVQYNHDYEYFKCLVNAFSTIRFGHKMKQNFQFSFDFL